MGHHQQGLRLKERYGRMPPSCAVVVGKGTGVENLQREAPLGSGLKPAEFEPNFVGKLKLPAT